MSAKHRQVWKDHFGDIPKGFDIHHIDCDNENNSIDNLVMLPRKLHQEYHRFAHLHGLKVSANIHFGYPFYIAKLAEDVQNLATVVIECCQWIDYREYLRGNTWNIHGIYVK